MGDTLWAVGNEAICAESENRPSDQVSPATRRNSAVGSETSRALWSTELWVVSPLWRSRFDCGIREKVRWSACREERRGSGRELKRRVFGGKGGSAAMDVESASERRRDGDGVKETKPRLNPPAEVV